MTYLEYMEAHENENLTWCIPYVDETEEYCIAVNEGDVVGIKTPSGEFPMSYDTTQADIDRAVSEVAKAVNPNYNFYSGWSDLRVALEAMNEVGCASCPFKADCDAMREEVNE